MKHCNRCNTDRPLDEFSKNKTKPDGLQNYCNHCKREIQRKHYANSPERRRKVRERREAARTKGRNFVLGFLQQNPCVDCGESDPVVLEFDHVRGVKEFAIALGKNVKTLDELKAEIGKCEVRCANCHRRRHAKERGFWNA